LLMCYYIRNMVLRQWQSRALGRNDPSQIRPTAPGSPRYSQSERARTGSGPFEDPR
jgi:hypothetical protein